MYAVNSDGHTPFDVMPTAGNGNNVRDILAEFGFSEHANAAAKAEV